MAFSSGVSVVVRRTFLELADESEELQIRCDLAKRCRAFTDSIALSKSKDESAESTTCDSSSETDSSDNQWLMSFPSSIGSWCDVSDDENDDQNDGEEPAVSSPGTLMLQGIPREYTRGMLCSLLDSVVAGRYDFVYLPQAFRKRKNNCSSFGYAFVNFCRHEDAQFAKDSLMGFTDWGFASDKVLDVVWSEACHGLDALVERYRNNPVMHHEVPDDCKPIILCSGVRVPFPPPTMRIQAPKR